MDFAGHAVQTPPEMYWFAEHDDAAPHAVASVSPSPVPGMAEFAAFVLPAVQSAHVQVDPDLAAYLFAGHVQDVAAPPALVEPTGHASHESPSQYWLASQTTAMHFAVSFSVPASHDLDPVRAYPALHVGSHEVPEASELEQGDATPFAIAPEAMHGAQASRLRHDPSEVEQSVQHCPLTGVAAA